MEAAGDCAWSVQGALINSASRKLVDETKRLGLAVEVYGVETGVGSQEHFIIAKGNIVLAEEKEYSEYFVEAYEENGTLEEAAAELGVTVDHMRENVNHNGDYTVGGFENWGEFSDLSRYLERDPNKVMLDDYLKTVLPEIEKVDPLAEASAVSKDMADQAAVTAEKDRGAR